MLAFVIFINFLVYDSLHINFDLISFALPAILAKLILWNAEMVDGNPKTR